MRRMKLALTSLVVIFSLTVVFAGHAAKRQKTEPVKQGSSTVVKRTKAAPSQAQGQTEEPQGEASQSELEDSTSTAVTSGSREGEQVHWQVMASGGGMQTLGDFKLGSTVGQPPVGTSSLGDYTLHSGFWQNFGGCCRNRGDVNHDGLELIDIGDLSWMVNYMFTGGPEPPCMEEADINGDGLELIDIGDLSYLVNFMFTGGPPPPPCP